MRAFPSQVLAAAVPLVAAVLVIVFTGQSNAADQKLSTTVQLLSRLSSSDAQSGEIVAFMVAYRNLADRVAALDRKPPSGSQIGNDPTGGAHDTALMWALLAANQKAEKRNQKAGAGTGIRIDKGIVGGANPCGVLAQSGVLASPYWKNYVHEWWRLPTQLEIDAAARSKQHEIFECRLKSAQALLAQLSQQQADLDAQIEAKEAEVRAALLRCALAVKAAQAAQSAQQASAGGFLATVWTGVATALGAGPIITSVLNAVASTVAGGPIGLAVQAIIWGNPGAASKFPDCVEMINLQAELEGLKQDLTGVQAAIQVVMARMEKLAEDEEAARRAFARKYPGSELAEAGGGTGIGSNKKVHSMVGSTNIMEGERATESAGSAGGGTGIGLNKKVRSMAGSTNIKEGERATEKAESGGGGTGNEITGAPPHHAAAGPCGDSYAVRLEPELLFASPYAAFARRDVSQRDGWQYQNLALIRQIAKQSGGSGFASPKLAPLAKPKSKSGGGFNTAKSNPLVASKATVMTKPCGTLGTPCSAGKGQRDKKPASGSAVSSSAADRTQGKISGGGSAMDRLSGSGTTTNTGGFSSAERNKRSMSGGAASGGGGSAVFSGGAKDSLPQYRMQPMAPTVDPRVNPR